jgi:hypothetical protein
MGKKEVKTHVWSLVIALAIVGVFFTFTAVSDVSARPYRLGKIPDKGAKFGCGTCHVNQAGGGQRNPFGSDYGKVGLSAGDKYTDKLGAMDSDGDGHSNDQEFKAGTNPGDPKSKPSK